MHAPRALLDIDSAGVEVAPSEELRRGYRGDAASRALARAIGGAVRGDFATAPPRPVERMAATTARGNVAPVKRERALTAIEMAKRTLTTGRTTYLRARVANAAGHTTNDKGDASLAEVRALLVERSMTNVRANDDGLGVTGQADDILRGLLAAAQRAIEKRYADSTRRKDRSYWRFWCEFCSLVGTPPLRTNTAANIGALTHLHEREVTIALGAFMTFVADNPKCKADSMLARLRGVARRHHTLGLKFVSLALVVTAAAGIVQ
jgi:hypothetical protein